MVSSLIELEQPLFGQLAQQVARLRSTQLDSCLQQQRREREPMSLSQMLCSQGLLTRGQRLEVLRRQARWLADALQGDMAPDSFPCDTFFSLCLPAYNEEATIEETLDDACAILPAFVQRFEVVVVNDGSHDRTAEIVRRYAERDNRVRLVDHETNRGYGSAVTSGLRAARGNLVAFTDSDGQFSLLNLPWFLSRIRDNDLVIGYRYRRADPWHRRFNARGWNSLVRAFLGVRVRDLDCAFKVFRADVLDHLQLTATGAAINAEIMVQCQQAGLRIAELPVSHYPRSHGVPTGAAFRVILRAFRELPPLAKYRSAAQPRQLATAPAHA